MAILAFFWMALTIMYGWPFVVASPLASFFGFCFGVHVMVGVVAVSRRAAEW